MSLAIYAAPFDDETSNLISKKKNNKSHKQIHNSKNDKKDNKVHSMLKEIHNSQDDNDEDELTDFTPPPKPVSIGGERAKEKNLNKENEMIDYTSKNVPKPIEFDDDINNNSYSSNDLKMNNVDDYYKVYIPEQKRNEYYKQYNVGSNNDSDALIQKLNYMISLLEEQQDERTSNVTEEVILYSFLGVFIIFVCDSFVRVGKYVR